jgi:hypothetical protein
MPPKLLDPADAANPIKRRYLNRIDSTVAIWNGPKLGQALRASTIIIPACSSIFSPKPVTS